MPINNKAQIKILEEQLDIKLNEQDIINFKNKTIELENGETKLLEKQKPHASLHFSQLSNCG